jgi:6-phosphogluconolactonase (cycloisomerase 2 family)
VPYLILALAEGTGAPSPGWSLSNAAYANKSLFVGPEDATPQGLTFKDDGTKLYVVGTGSDRIRQYSLSTPWDVTTATLEASSPGTITGNPASVTFKPDGTVVYVVIISNDQVAQYNLSTPWDITSISANGVKSVTTQDTVPRDVEFNVDGTKMYMLGDINNLIYQYSLSTPWDVTTATSDAISAGFGASGVTNPNGFNIKSDGTTVFVANSTATATSAIYQFTMSTPWDLSTLTYDTLSFNVSSQGLQPGSVFVGDSGTKMYTVDYNVDSVFQYSL